MLNYSNCQGDSGHIPGKKPVGKHVFRPKTFRVPWFQPSPKICHATYESKTKWQLAIKSSGDHKLLTWYCENSNMPIRHTHTEENIKYCRNQPSSIINQDQSTRTTTMSTTTTTETTTTTTTTTTTVTTISNSNRNMVTVNIQTSALSTPTLTVLQAYAFHMALTEITLEPSWPGTQLKIQRDSNAGNCILSLGVDRGLSYSKVI